MAVATTSTTNARTPEVASPSTLRISRIMTREPICIEPDATLREVARLLEELEISGAPVVDENRRILGVVSKTDVLRRCLEGRANGLAGDLFESLSDDAGEEMGLDPEDEILVEDFMSTDVVTAREDEAVAVVARRMAEARIHRAVVVDDDEFPVGIVTSLDVLKALGAK